MKLICDKCHKEYSFPDNSLKGIFYSGALHLLMPVGQRLGCDGVLKSTSPVESGELDFRSIASSMEKADG